jgi:hypothetical protein
MKRTALFFLLPTLGALPVISQSIPGYAIANAKHYRESGVGNAKGRTGSAHMTARALLGEDGNTTIEVSTGVLDSAATPPGSFAKVQFKPLDPDGDAMVAQNFTTLSTATGYYSFSWPTLYRHQQAQIQGNITGIDNRTDVVTVVDTVKLRPDLAIQNFHIPTSAYVDAPVTIPANVVELNGDSPAITTCQLAVDGTVVDHASNVYVDAGGSVSCAFAYTFAATGSHTIQVTAANVAPGDWDTANNSASGTINIVENASIAEHGTASFFDQKGGFPLSNTFTMQAWQNGSSVYNYSNTTGTTGEEQDAETTFHSGACAGSTNAVPYQFPVDITYTETMDGTSVYSAKATGITGGATSTAVNKAMCGSTAMTRIQQVGSGVADDYTFRVTSDTYYDSASIPISMSQQVESTRNAGDVTYLSSGYQCQWFSDCSNPPTNYYMWNNPSQTVLGNLVPLGSTWGASITARDAGGNGFGGSISVSLSNDQITSGRPNTCRTTTDASGLTVQSCSSSLTNYTVTQGSASY